jgi:hypothetical protein
MDRAPAFYLAFRRELEAASSNLAGPASNLSSFRALFDKKRFNFGLDFWVSKKAKV